MAGFEMFQADSDSNSIIMIGEIVEYGATARIVPNPQHADMQSSLEAGPGNEWIGSLG